MPENTTPTIPPAATALDPSELLYWGDDGQWLAHPGHVDLDEFTKVADARSREDDPGLADDERPSSEGEAYHTWFRPMTREWFDANAGWRDCPEETKARRFAEYSAEGAMEPCGPDDADAEAWTLIETGA